MFEFVEKTPGGVALPVKPAAEGRRIDTVWHGSIISPGSTFGEPLAKDVGIVSPIRQRRDPAFEVRHLDEIFVKPGGTQMWLWRAVDGEGEVLNILVQRRRDKRAAMKLMRKLLTNQGVRPLGTVTGKLKSYGAAFRDLRLAQLQETGHRLNNRA